MSERSVTSVPAGEEPVTTVRSADPWPERQGIGPGTPAGAEPGASAVCDPLILIRVGSDSGVSLSGADSSAVEITQVPDDEDALVADLTPPHNDPSATAVPTHPGSVGFPVGSGAGQWLLFGIVVVVVLACMVVGAYPAAMLLAAVLAGCGLARAVLPGRWVPALVNRGKPFDVTMWWVGALVLAALAQTAPQF